jgi:hypothetical protein
MKGFSSNFYPQFLGHCGSSPVRVAIQLSDSLMILFDFAFQVSDLMIKCFPNMLEMT